MRTSKGQLTAVYPGYCPGLQWGGIILFLAVLAAGPSAFQIEYETHALHIIDRASFRILCEYTLHRAHGLLRYLERF